MHRTHSPISPKGASFRGAVGPRLPLFASALALAAGSPAPAKAIRVDIVPQPLSAQFLASASPTVVSPGEAILVARGDSAALEVARQLSGWVLKTRGVRLVPRVAAGAEPNDAIRLVRRADPSQGPEGYQLEIGDGRATITAAGGAGLFYGAASLWQLLTADDGRGAVRLQPVRIEDRPRFAWRGLLLDSARHYQSPAFIERLIDWMALHKLNVLQWHLTDDQGWRLEVPKYPRLTAVGAWRIAAGPDLDFCPAGKRPCLYGGFYTQAQIRRLVAYAETRHVTIVPEIEMPGHALAAILAYPDLGSAGRPSPVLQDDWGVFPWLYAPTDKTFAFLDTVLTEVMELFPSHFIAIGGDEAVKDQWRASPAIQAQIKALGLADEDALQAWFTAKICTFLEAHGRRPIGWDDILAAGLDRGAAVLSWHLGGALKAAAANHDVVIATDPILYFDHRQSDLPSEPPGRGDVVSLRDVFQYEPAPATLTAEERAHFIGVQANLWTEHIRTDERLEKMAFPRAAALAELGWTAPERKGWTRFAARLPAEIARYRPLGLNADPGALMVKLDASPDPATGGVDLALSNQLGVGQIRYTLDGSAPEANSSLYERPIAAPLPVRVRAADFMAGRPVSPFLDRNLGQAQVLRRTSQELSLCTSKLALNLEERARASGLGPLYLIDIMNPCWIYRNAELTGVDAILVSLAQIPFNFQLGADMAKIVLRPPSTPGGELEIRMDSCAGELVASFPLERVGLSGGAAILTAAIPPHSGRHDLCASFTAHGGGPLMALDWLQLSPYRLASAGAGR
ncbi:MAG: family 20 glycosylhydrolase [Caulobacteraceae bacterium]